jgi:hypothetical protein
MGGSGRPFAEMRWTATDLQMDQGLEGTGSGWKHPGQNGKPVLVAPGRRSEVATPRKALAARQQAPHLDSSRCAASGAGVSRWSSRRQDRRVRHVGPDGGGNGTVVDRAGPELSGPRAAMARSNPGRSQRGGSFECQEGTVRR